ncbi:MAG TPA: hypothetical protein VJG67_01820 [Candidatus Paceibacterota bacterium]
MQIIQSKGNIVEKVLRDKEGRLIRARFYVYENAGRIKARLIDFTYVYELVGRGVSALSGFIKKIIVWTRALNQPVFSQFVFKSIYMSGSKPRAPTL